jgi:Protein of unknown function (DUF3293)
LLRYVVILMSDLFDSYRRTSFLVETPLGQLHLRIGEPSAELDQLLKANGVQRWAYVTGFNPGSVPLGAEENERRQARLEQEVERLGYAKWAGEGVGDDGTWPPEPSVLILGIPKGNAVELGRRFGQRAIVYGELGGPAVLMACD